MATSSVTLAVDVQLQTTQKSIEQLRKALQSVEKDTMAFHGLNAQINEIERSFQKVATAAKGSFSNKRQLTDFQDQFSDLTDQIQGAARTIESLNINNLNLQELFGVNRANEITNQFQAIEKSITEARNKLQAFSSEQIGRLAADPEISAQINQLNSSLPTLQLNIAGEGIEVTLQKIGQAAEATANDLQNLNSTFSSTIGGLQVYRDRLQNFSTIRQAISSDTSPQQAAQNFEKLLGTFQGENTQQRANELADFYGFSQEAVNAAIELVQQRTSQAQQKLARILTDNESFNTAESSTRGQVTRRQNSLAEIRAQIDQARNNLELLQQAEERLLEGQANIQQSDGYKQLTADAQQATEAKEAYTKALKQEAEEALAAANITKSSNTAYNGVTSEVQRCTVALENLAAANRQLGQIRSTIEMFFGLHRVINLTRNAIVNAFNQIKTLDSVMTEIAVVTNMTQQDLWGSIGEYSAIAQQYAVATEGVYRISQIYYQQGLSTVEVNRLTTETLKMAKVANIDYADAADYESHVA